ncbi:MAG: DUF1801 domain-containing protein [Bacteroidota bacterium]
MTDKKEYALEVEQYISEAEQPYQEWMRDLRVLMHEAESEIKERLGRGIPVFSYHDYDICYMAYNSQQITLGFYRGNELHDPFNVLDGTGEQLRFLHITKESDIRSKRITSWIRHLTESTTV